MSAVTPLLATKLYIPRVRTNYVARPHLMTEQQERRTT